MSITSDSLENPAHDPKAPLKAMFAGLPHRYGYDWYSWAWDFYKSRNKMNLLCAANQISKSSTQIRKIIEWAGNPKLWPSLWSTEPKQFWYLYPDAKTATSEFDTKWIDFLPRGAYKDHPTYGWKEYRAEKRSIEYIQFNSGVRIYFKTYTQNVKNLQAGTAHAIFCDEELPEELFPELMARLFSTDGYFSMVFTATLNQDFWRAAIEGEGDLERFPEAFKLQVSMRDCTVYRNGKPGHFTEERIRQIEATCKNEMEKQRRVNGRFITVAGRKYPQFDSLKHFIRPITIPGDWRKYSAVDLGGGGEGHSPAIAFVAVRPDNRYGVVYKGWKGDDGQVYTNGDVFNKYQELKDNDLLVSQRYDWGAKDFGTIATRAGDTFTKAEKSHDKGEDVVNTLFKNDMLYLFDDEEIGKLGTELTSLMQSTPKRKAKDDFADALRYAVVEIPWDWSCLKGEDTEETVKKKRREPYTQEEYVAMEIAARRGAFFDPRAPKETDGWGDFYEECSYWNEIAGTG